MKKWSALILLLALPTACKGGAIDVPPPPQGEQRVAVGAEDPADPTAAGEPDPDPGKAAASAKAKPGARPAKAAPADGPIDEADDAAPAAVAAPRGATPGDVLPPLPKAAPRLGRGGKAGSAPTEPEMPCDQLAPDGSWKLANRTVIERNPAKAGAPATSMELCLFHKWLPRDDADKQRRTGRQHLFVAAFPGTEVEAWTSDELEFAPKSLPEDAAVSAAGWAALVPTGLPEMPALAVVSARFYDGAHAEEVHYRRVGRLLRQSRGRWAFTELETLDQLSLDLGHIDGLCAGDTPPEGCEALQRRAAAWRADAEGRSKRRALRLDGKAARSPGKAPDGDPQSAWLQQARAASKRNKHEAAALAALRVEMACGEAVKEAREVLADAAKAQGGAEKADPRPKAADLCEPGADKGGPPRK